MGNGRAGVGNWASLTIEQLHLKLAELHLMSARDVCGDVERSSELSSSQGHLELALRLVNLELEDAAKTP